MTAEPMDEQALTDAIKRAKHEVDLARGAAFYAHATHRQRSSYDGGGSYLVGGRTLGDDEVIEIAVKAAFGITRDHYKHEREAGQ